MPTSVAAVCSETGRNSFIADVRCAHPERGHGGRVLLLTRDENDWTDRMASCLSSSAVADEDGLAGREKRGAG